MPYSCRLHPVRIRISYVSDVGWVDVGNRPVRQCVFYHFLVHNHQIRIESRAPTPSLATTADCLDDPIYKRGSFKTSRRKADVLSTLANIAHILLVEVLVHRESLWK
jgi:hypothetical protein